MSQINLHNHPSREAFKSPFKNDKTKSWVQQPKEQVCAELLEQDEKQLLFCGIQLALPSSYPTGSAHSHCSAPLWTGLAQWVDGHLVSSGHCGGRRGWRLLIPQAVAENRFQLAASTPTRMWGTSSLQWMVVLSTLVSRQTQAPWHWNVWRHSH